MRDYNRLIPELAEWDSGQGIDAESWVTMICNFQMTVAYTTVFWPEFVVVDDCVFLEDYAREFYETMRNKGTSRRDMEQMLNHQHIADIHSYGDPNATRERVVFIGNILKEIYECKLGQTFPDRVFSVEFVASGDDVSSYALHFCQV